MTWFDFFVGLFCFVVGCAIGARHGVELRTRTIVRYIRRRCVPADGPPPMLSQLAREIEDQWGSP